jgi:quercetin dioxygenase-like cupin family protein
LWAATDQLTVGQIELLPGQYTEPHAHGGDESIYLLEGTLHIRTPDNDGPRWFELNPRDGFYIPEGVSHQYYNVSNEPARLIFGVAPHYLQEG